MGNALAIAAVTAVLKDLLENGLVSDSIAGSVGDVIVTALPPDRISIGADERAQLNLFLYQVTQNRNVDWVTRERYGDYPLVIGDLRSTNPPLALDLHYLLTVYGAKDFQAELLLGYALQLFHETSILNHEVIYTALKNASTVNISGVLSQAIASVSVSELAAQIRQIKICPEFFNMEETSKLWSALQTHYRPSAAYQVSMVLIENRHSNNSLCLSALFAQPLIEKVASQTEVGQRIVADSTLVIRGKRLRGDTTRVRLMGIEALLVPQKVKETEIILPLPHNLYAGVQGVQVVHLGMGTATTQSEVESNVAAFVLHPTIAVTVTQVQSSESDLHAVEIAVKFQPKVGKGQRVVLLLNKIDGGETTAYSFTAQTLTEDTDLIAILIKDVKTGRYLVRVQVDGAESPLSLNQNGEYDSPQITIA